MIGRIAISPRAIPATRLPAPCDTTTTTPPEMPGEGPYISLLCHVLQHHQDPMRTMLVVVVREELLAEGPGVLDAAEAGRERRAVLEGLEVCLAVGVVVRHVGPAVGAPDAE